MQSKIFISSLILTGIMYSNSWAEEVVQELETRQPMSLKTQDGLEIGLQNYWYKYEEEVNGAFFMSNTGYKYGVSVTGTKNLGNDYYLIGDFRYATGDVEYTSASGTGDVSDDVFEGRLVIGNESIVENYLLSSYIGVGYRRLDNDLRDLGSGGYRRTSQYLYIPIGVTHRFLVDQFSRVSTSVEYDYFVRGKQKSYLSDVSPADAALYGDPVNKQKKGYGIRVNTAYEQEHWSIGMFFNYWKIQDSETNYYVAWPWIYSVKEPKNDTKELGLQIKYRF